MDEQKKGKGLEVAFFLLFPEYQHGANESYRRN